MQTEINELLQPTPFELTDSVSDELQQIMNKETAVLPAVLTHNIILWAIKHAKDIRNSNGYQKPEFQLTNKHSISRIENCTDDSIIQLLLLKEARLSSFARFQGKHASVVVDDAPHYWHIDNDLSIGIKNSSTLNGSEDIEKIQATEKALEEVRERQSVGCYVFLNHYNVWEHEMIDEEVGIRRSSPYHYREDIHPRNSFVLVKPPLAFHMLTAIDIAENINSSVNTPQDAIARSLVLPTLIPFIPKLR